MHFYMHLYTYIHINMCVCVWQYWLSHISFVKLRLTAFCVMNAPSPCVITVARPYCLSSARICQQHRISYHCTRPLIKQLCFHCCSRTHIHTSYMYAAFLRTQRFFLLSFLFDLQFLLSFGFCFSVFIVWKTSKKGV